ncbi:dihydroorotase [Moorella sulfitireducens]|uniref:dihydroorotase n=1 Tax=Neomoorella sulfitireducens TaxID=2972948 RepID=UPI0021AD2858|nr:dihydroorotase [Moorella sulfitireducens]
MVKVLLKGGRVVDPGNDIDRPADVLIEDGKIARIGSDIEAGNAEIINVAGKVVAPGLIDIHCHLRDPGFPEREDFKSGTRAAARGGFTTLIAMPNTNPVCDHPVVAEYVLARSKREGVVNVLPYGAITRGQKGEELAPFTELVEAGCVAFSDDGQPVTNSGLMRQALIIAGAINKVLAVHCEDRTITGDGVINDGEVARRLGIKGIPYTSEAVMVARDILLAEETGGRVHICHVGCARSVELIREGKKRGINVTGEVIPHYLNTTEDDVQTLEGRFKIKPPFGSKRDQEALKEGLVDGTIDVIATDHAPYTIAEKERNFREAPFGLIGLETALGVVLTEMVHSGLLTLAEALAKMTCNPAKLLGLNKGTLGVGRDADVIVIDPDLEWQVDANQGASKSRNCPQHGRWLKGKAVMTMLGGRVVMQDGKLLV